MLLHNAKLPPSIPTLTSASNDTIPASHLPYHLLHPTSSLSRILDLAPRTLYRSPRSSRYHPSMYLASFHHPASPPFGRLPPPSSLISSPSTCDLSLFPTTASIHPPVPSPPHRTSIYLPSPRSQPTSTTPSLPRFYPLYPYLLLLLSPSPIPYCFHHTLPYLLPPFLSFIPYLPSHPTSYLPPTLRPYTLLYTPQHLPSFYALHSNSFYAYTVLVYRIDLSQLRPSRDVPPLHRTLHRLISPPGSPPALFDHPFTLPRPPPRPVFVPRARQHVASPPIHHLPPSTVPRPPPPPLTVYTPPHTSTTPPLLRHPSTHLYTASTPIHHPLHSYSSALPQYSHPSTHTDRGNSARLSLDPASARGLHQTTPPHYFDHPSTLPRPPLHSTSTTPPPYLDNSSTLPRPPLRPTSTTPPHYFYHPSTLPRPPLHSTSTTPPPYLDNSSTLPRPPLRPTSTTPPHYFYHPSTLPRPPLHSTSTTPPPYLDNSSTLPRQLLHPTSTTPPLYLYHPSSLPLPPLHHTFSTRSTLAVLPLPYLSSIRLPTLHRPTSQITIRRWANVGHGRKGRSRQANVG
eukprot:XP_011669829.1 PREDICTED: leucine-rich repeat extensin-like protein 5 [Strongylocentrotus purpuratus]